MWSAVLPQYILIINIVLLHSVSLLEINQSNIYSYENDYVIELTVKRKATQNIFTYPNITDTYYFDEGLSLKLNCHRNNKQPLQWRITMEGWTSPIKSESVNSTSYFIDIRGIPRYYDGLEATCVTKYNSNKTLILKYNGISTDQAWKGEVLELNVGEKDFPLCGNNKTTGSGNGAKHKRIYRYLVEYTDSLSSKHSDISGIKYDRIGMKDNGTKIVCAEFYSGLKYQKQNGISIIAETLELEIKRKTILVLPNNSGSTSDFEDENMTSDTQHLVLIGGIIMFFVLIIMFVIIYKLIIRMIVKRKLEAHIYEEIVEVVYAQIQVAANVSVPAIEKSS